MTATEAVEPFQIALSKIVMAPEVQIRTRINKTKVAEYMEMIGDGVRLDPITLVMDDQDRYIIADGFHRFQAYMERGLKSIRATVFECHPAEAVSIALEISCERNSKHGLPLSAKDKRHAVTLLVSDQMHKHKSDTAISKMIGVSAGLVKAVRAEVYAPPEKEINIEPPKKSKPSTPAPKEIVDDGDITRERIKNFTRWVMDGEITWQHVQKAFTSRGFTPMMIPAFPHRMRISREDGTTFSVMCDDLEVMRRPDGGMVVKVKTSKREDKPEDQG